MIIYNTCLSEQHVGQLFGIPSNTLYFILNNKYHVLSYAFSDTYNLTEQNLTKKKHTNLTDKLVTVFLLKDFCVQKKMKMYLIFQKHVQKFLAWTLAQSNFYLSVKMCLFQLAIQPIHHQSSVPSDLPQITILSFFCKLGVITVPTTWNYSGDSKK